MKFQDPSVNGLKDTVTQKNCDAGTDGRAKALCPSNFLGIKICYDICVKIKNCPEH